MVWYYWPTTAEYKVGIGGRVDPSRYIWDPNRDPLTFSATVSNGKVTAKVESSTLVIDAIEAGEAAVTVTASDGKGESVQASITVTVTECTLIAVSDGWGYEGVNRWLRVPDRTWYGRQRCHGRVL